MNWNITCLTYFIVLCEQIKFLKISMFSSYSFNQPTLLVYMHVYYEYKTFISQYNKCEKFLSERRCWTFISQTLNVPMFIHLQSLLKQMFMYKTCATQWNDII